MDQQEVARRLVMWSAQEDFSVEKSRRHLDHPIKRHVARSYSIAKSGIESWTSERISSPKTPIRKIAKSRNDHCRPFQRTGGSRSTHRHIGISEFGVFKDIGTGPRNSQNRDTRYSDTISAVRLSGHVASIAAPVDISAFGVSRCQRNLTSQLAKSRYAKSR